MSVKVHCSICEKFIKNVDNNEFDKLTGREMCSFCGEKVKDLFNQLINIEKEHVSKISLAFNTIMARYKKVQSAHDSTIAQVQDMYRVARNELEAALKDILER